MLPGAGSILRGCPLLGGGICPDVVSRAAPEEEADDGEDEDGHVQDSLGQHTRKTRAEGSQLGPSIRAKAVYWL